MNKLINILKNKIRKLRGNPKVLAKSFALGSFIGVSPLVGMQVLISLFLSGLFRLDKTAAVVGVLNTNWTKGLLLYPLNYKIGASLLGIDSSFDVSTLAKGNLFHNIWNSGMDIFLSLLVVGIITGLLIATIYYFLILKILNTNPLNTQHEHL